MDETTTWPVAEAPLEAGLPLPPGVELGGWDRPPDPEPAPPPEPSGIILTTTEDDPRDWQLTCRYCLAVSKNSQGRATHERTCINRPDSPPLGDGDYSIRVWSPTHARYTWEASLNGEVRATALGRTWTVARDCEDNAQQFLHGAWTGPTRDTQRKNAAAKAAREKRAKGKGKSATTAEARQMTKARREATPVKAEPVTGPPLPPSDLLSALDTLAGGGTWPTSALPEIGRWMMETQALLKLAVPKS